MRLNWFDRLIHHCELCQERADFAINLNGKCYLCVGCADEALAIMQEVLAEMDPAKKGTQTVTIKAHR